MRIPKPLLAGLLPLTLLVACSDDDTPVTAGDEQDGGGTTDAPDGDVPERAPDLVGTITDVAPFVPITEGCTPPEDLDPDGAVSNEDPPVCTPEDNEIVGTVLVEEDPNAAEGGRKISYTVTSGTAFDGVDSFDDLAEGQQVDTWIDGGMCAESYPEQCGLEAVRVTG